MNPTPLFVIVGRLGRGGRPVCYGSASTLM